MLGAIGVVYGDIGTSRCMQYRQLFRLPFAACRSGLTCSRVVHDVLDHHAVDLAQIRDDHHARR